jgi:hypothetical protein
MHTSSRRGFKKVSAKFYNVVTKSRSMASIDATIQLLEPLPERTLILAHGVPGSVAEAHIFQSYDHSSNRITLNTYLSYRLTREDRMREPGVWFPVIHQLGPSGEEKLDHHTYVWRSTKSPSLFAGEDVYTQLERLQLSDFGPFLRLIEALGDFNRELPEYRFINLSPAIRG